MAKKSLVLPTKRMPKVFVILLVLFTTEVSSFTWDRGCKTVQTAICMDNSNPRINECHKPRDRNMSLTCKSTVGEFTLKCASSVGTTVRDTANRCCSVSVRADHVNTSRTPASCFVNVSKCNEDGTLYSIHKVKCAWNSSEIEILVMSSQLMALRNTCNISFQPPEKQCDIEKESVSKLISADNKTYSQDILAQMLSNMSRDVQTVVEPFENCTALSMQETLARIEATAQPVLKQIFDASTSNGSFSYKFTSEVLDLHAVVSSGHHSKLSIPKQIGQEEPSGVVSLSTSAIPQGPEESNNTGRLAVLTVVLKFTNTCKSIPLVGMVNIRDPNSPPALASPIISVLAMTGQGIVHKLRGNATLRFKLKKHSVSPKCVFLNHTASPEYAWSSSGITNVNDPEGNYTVCLTDHLTSFAVLLMYHDSGSQSISPADEFRLDLITKIGCGIALFCLAACILTFACVGSLSALRYRIHLNLCIALSVAILVFMTGVEATKYKAVCITVAVLLHYFFTAAFAWMCVEAIHLFFKIVSVFDVEITRMRYYMIIGWGLPAVIVAVSAAVYHEGYSTSELCWLSLDKSFIWAFIAPVIVITLIEIVTSFYRTKVNVGVLVAIIAVRVSLKGNPLKPKDNERFLGALKALVILFPLLGLSWLFGLLGVLTKSLPFLYVFVVLTSLQGVFILVFQCMASSEVRGSIKAIRQRHTLNSSIRHEMENKRRENRVLHTNGSCTSACDANSRTYFAKLPLLKSTKQKDTTTNV